MPKPSIASLSTKTRIEDNDQLANIYLDSDLDPVSTSIDYNDDNADDDSAASSSADEEAARDDYLNELGRIIEQVQDELEAEVESSDKIYVDSEKITEAIETLSELLHIRSEQLAEKELPSHVDERVEEYR